MPSAAVVELSTEHEWANTLFATVALNGLTCHKCSITLLKEYVYMAWRARGYTHTNPPAYVHTCILILVLCLDEGSLWSLPNSIGLTSTTA